MRLPCRLDRFRARRLNAAAAIVLLLAVAACNTTSNAPPPETPVKASTDAAADPSAQPAEPAKTEAAQAGEPAGEAQAPVEEKELVYDPDSLTFDIRLSAALRSADNVLFLKTPSGVNLNEIPDELDKWLSRIRDNGGTVKAAPLPADGKPSRSLLGILIDVILFFVGLAKDEIIFSAIDDFNALMYFDRPTGDVKWIVFTRRE